MLMIRLQRVGRKNEPHFRVVVTEKTTSPKGKSLEVVGFVNPRKNTKSLNQDRVLHWMSQGAKTSDTVFNLLVSNGIIRGKKIPKHKISKKKSEKQEAQTLKKEEQQASSQSSETTLDSKPAEKIEKTEKEVPAEETAQEEVKQEAQIENK